MPIGVARESKHPETDFSVWRLVSLIRKSTCCRALLTRRASIDSRKVFFFFKKSSRTKCPSYASIENLINRCAPATHCVIRWINFWKFDRPRLEISIGLEINRPGELITNRRANINNNPGTLRYNQSNPPTRQRASFGASKFRKYPERSEKKAPSA